MAALVINVVAAVSSGDVPLNAVQVYSLFHSVACACRQIWDIQYLGFLITVTFFTASLGESYHGYSRSTCFGN